MKILADENIDAPVVRWLRERGLDVLWVAEDNPGSKDPAVLVAAESTGRILVTSDLDFGELVYRRRLATRGVLLLRIQAQSASEFLDLFKKQWPSVHARIEGHFVVMHNTRVRIRPLVTSRP